MRGWERSAARSALGGLLLLVDSRSNDLKVADGDGRLLRTMGRYGEGPGEFQTAELPGWSQLMPLDEPPAGMAAAQAWIQSATLGGAMAPAGGRLYRQCDAPRDTRAPRDVRAPRDMPAPRAAEES